MAITLSEGVIDYDNIKNNLILDPVTQEVIGLCTHPAGHCYGSDGGSGIPNNLKVAEGRGGDKEVWELNGAKTKVNKKYIYSRCQYCQKYLYVKTL